MLPRRLRQVSVRILFCAVLRSLLALGALLLQSGGTLANGNTPIHPIQVRLADGVHPREGRVEVLWHGTWGTVCDDNWDNNDATVICRMLHYGGGTAVSNAYFGQGDGPVLLTDVGCMGDEATLNQCPIGYMVSNCGHHEDAGVKCSTGPDSSPVGGGRGGLGSPMKSKVPLSPSLPLSSRCTNPSSKDPPLKIRLLGKEGENWAGWVQVLASNGTWGLVCDDNWDLLAAQMVCRDLCFSPQEAEPGWLSSSMKLPVMPIVLDDVKCFGNESSFLKCNHRPEFTHDCGPSELASVSCKRTAPPTKIPAPEASVECSETEIIVALARDVDPNMTERHLTVERSFQNGGRCVPGFRSNSTHILIFLNFINCAVILQNETHLTYSTLVVVEPSSREEPSGFMSRDLQFVVTASCEMPRGESKDKSILSPTSQEVRAVANTTLPIIMQLFTDDTFSTPVTFQGLNIVPSGSWVNVGLTLKTQDPRLQLVVPDCVAAPDPPVSSLPVQVLLRNKCPVESTLSVHTISDFMLGLRFQPFSFVGSTNMIVKCNAYVCTKVSASQPISSQCDRSCNSSKPLASRRARRRSPGEGGQVRDIRTRADWRGVAQQPTRLSMAMSMLPTATKHPPIYKTGRPHGGLSEYLIFLHTSPVP
ncbi:uncharacterized protein LOC112575252 isoform X1 [Pomacea canaliculata]|uniref:uncharacterized protein LOC112575252 isoform X1 n=1 Tax=Pomacea canaliculata TaxID=400727 RepID=UPI000D73BA86|nr:uncharacterized protein LOC112575252 isoform X1 [Pomacea canaliculata]